MKTNKLTNLCLGLSMTLLTASCVPTGETKSYNEGINIIPMPQSLTVQDGTFRVNNSTSISAKTSEAKTVAEYFAMKMRRSTGYDIPVGESGNIKLNIDPSMEINTEGYRLNVTGNEVNIEAKTAQGLFYGLQSFMQLLPAEIESPEKVNGIAWTAQSVSITDEPRFSYRGLMIDPCRHFMTVDEIKKQLDVMALFKMNRMHWHLTEDQGWRIEIKKYPKLTEVGSKRIEGEGYEYGPFFYTQEDIKEVVKYASERFITIVPEIELPGHELAAISAYPELSCKGQPISPRIIWGVEDVVMCAGKELPFEFMENVIAEVAQLFPGEYLHIGGDECPKTSWKNCPLCQKRIRQEGLQAKDGHSAEERLQSYFVQRMEKVAAKYGKKIIGWDEILEGGLSPTATVMSWRGEKGGIAAALTSHDVIMTPGSNGLYLDYYQGDSKIEPVSIGGYSPLEKTYSYNPTPDTLVAMGKEHFIKGVQGNVWSEYLYNNSIREYMTFPRALAIAEVGWTNTDRKDYKDFERRINNAYVRMDAHGINYHIPMPEQPGGSCNFVAFTDQTTLEFKTSRPEKMVYTTDGSEPTAQSDEYTAPLTFNENTTLKIATVLPSGKLSKVRTVTIQKQTPSKGEELKNPAKGLKIRVKYGSYLNTDGFDEKNMKFDDKKIIKTTRELTSVVKHSESMRGVKQYAAIANGYINIEEDGVYYFSSDLEEVWIDGKLLISNKDEVKRFSRNDKSVALGKGMHEIKAIFLGHIIGGWPSNWNDGSIKIKKAGSEKFENIGENMLFH